MYLQMRALVRLGADITSAALSCTSTCGSCLPLIVAHFKDSASQLSLADLREVLNLPCELPI